jgi:hypothetical protein
MQHSVSLLEMPIVPACETDSPASSINWSIENAPVDMSSWSRAAALLAESVLYCFSTCVVAFDVKFILEVPY